MLDKKENQRWKYVFENILCCLLHTKLVSGFYSDCQRIVEWTKFPIHPSIYNALGATIELSRGHETYTIPCAHELAINLTLVTLSKYQLSFSIQQSQPLIYLSITL